MPSFRRRRNGWLALVAILASIPPSLAAEGAFPFDRELILEAAPMPGSKRIPMLEIGENGEASIDLWCASVQGRATFAAGAITIETNPIGQDQCPPERAQRDTELLTAVPGHELAP